MNGAITIVAGTTIHAINKANSPIAIPKNTYCTQQRNRKHSVSIKKRSIDAINLYPPFLCSILRL